MVCTCSAVRELCCYTSTHSQHVGPEGLTTATWPAALSLHSTPAGSLNCTVYMQPVFQCSPGE